MAAQVNEGDGTSPIAEQISPAGLGGKFVLNVTARAISSDASRRVIHKEDPMPRGTSLDVVPAAGVCAAGRVVVRILNGLERALI